MLFTYGIYIDISNFETSDKTGTIQRRLTYPYARIDDKCKKSRNDIHIDMLALMVGLVVLVFDPMKTHTGSSFNFLHAG